MQYLFFINGVYLFAKRDLSVRVDAAVGQHFFDTDQLVVFLPYGRFGKQNLF